jgi:hypothetical protein
MGAQNETLDLSQSAFQLVRVVVRRTKGRYYTYWNCLCVNFKILSNSAKCPISTILSASSKTRNRRFFTSSASSSSCSGLFSVYNQEDRLCLTPSRTSHNLPGVATRTSTPRSSIRRCFCVDIPPTIAATLTGGGARGTDGPFSFPLLIAFRFPFFGISLEMAAMS